jgi:hypothetical protein
MVQLVLIYCMIANSAVCKEARPMMDGSLSLMGCMTAAQQTAATWVDEHPQWRLASWKCQVGVPEEARL